MSDQPPFLEDRRFNLNPPLCDESMRLGSPGIPMSVEIPCLFLQALAATTDGILIRDQTGCILYTNEAFQRMFGYSKEEIIGRNFLSFFPQENHDAIKQEILPLLHRLGEWRGEVEAQQKDGTRFPVSIAASCLKDEQGRPNAYVSIYQDITPEREMQQKFAQTERMASLGEILAGVAHELSNPLTSVIGFSELVLRMRVRGEVKRQIKKIVSEAIRTSKIVRNLLSIARPQKLEKVPIGVNGVIQCVLDLKMHQLKLDNIRVIRRLAKDAALPKVHGDYHQLVEAFLNLIHNAHQAMASAQKHGALTIKTEAVDADAVIRISDTGPGIPKEIQAKLFQPFFTTKENGTGLGLHLTHNIIKAHGGFISVESAEGRGTSFIIRLPIASNELPLAFRSEAAALAGTESRELEILTVDDEGMILNLYYHFLTQLGHRPTLVKSAKEAVAQLEKKRFDLIITDIRIARMGGDQLYAFIQKNHPSIAERMIFATGDILNTRTEQFINRHRLNVLYKPFSLNQLEQMIRTVCRKADEQ